MADFTGIELRIVLPSNIDQEVDKRVKELQRIVNKHTLSIGFDLSSDAIKGLETLTKNAQTTAKATKNLQDEFDDLEDTMEKVGRVTKEVFKLDSKGNLKKQVTEIEEEFGQLLRIMEKVDKKGNLKVTGTERTINYEKQKQALDALNASQLKMLQSLEKLKAYPQLAEQIGKVESKIKGLDLTNISKTNTQQIQNEINSLGLLAREIDKVSRQKEADARKTEQQMRSYIGLMNQVEKTLQSQSAKLNSKFQNSLSLQNKVGNLAPSDSSSLLIHQLDRYKKIIAEFQRQNELGITIKPETLDKIQNLENRIKRLYETTKKSQQDSHGFDFKQFESFDRLNPKITDARNKQEYYNKSILEGHKLVKTLTQETENYIKVTQQLRQGSVHKDIGVYIDKATGQMYKFNDATRDGMTRSWGLGEAIYTAGTKAMIWSSVMGTFYGLLEVLQQIPATIIEIDTRLTEMSKVMDNSTNFPELMGDLNQSANTYGRTITEVQDAVIEFAKAGYEGEQAVSLANTALIGANVSLMKTSEVANFVTGIMSQFNVTFEEATRIIDKINEVDNESSATFQGIAQGLLKSGETAQQFGVDLNELIGYITAVQTATRESGNQIGNAFKTMFARINMDKAADALASVGIATKDVSGELRSASHIYSDVAIKWDTLSRAQKTYIAEAMAGKYHITRFMALMDNWKIATDATRISQQSLFSAYEENEKHMQSLQSQINQVKTAFQEFANTLGEAGVKSAMSSLLGATKTFINGLTEMTESGVIAKLALGALMVSVAGLTIKFGSMIPIIRGLTASIISMTAAIATNPFGMIAIALTSVIGAMTMYYGKQKQIREEQEQLSKTVAESTQKFRELKEAMESVGKPTMENINTTEGMIKSYEDLTKSIEKARQSAKEEIIQTFKIANPDADISKLKIDVPFEPEKLSQGIKDLSSELRINIYEFESYDKLLAVIKTRIAELNIQLKQGQKHSTEYQAEQIKQAQNQLDLANNSKALVDEYFKLNDIQKRNEQQNKRLADVKRMLMAMFPQEFANGKNLQALLTEEANKRVQLAETTVGQTKRQLEANRQSQQIAYETAVKNMAVYQAEINVLKALWDARANNASGGQPSSMADFRVIENLGMAERKFNDAKDKANDLAEVLKGIDDVLNWKPAPVSIPDGGGGSKSGTGTSMENQLEKYIDLTKQAKNEYFELYNLVTKKIELGIVKGNKEILETRVKDYETYVNKLFEITSNLNQKILDITAKRNDYKKGSKEWNNATTLIEKYKADLKSLPAIQQESVKTLQKLNQQLETQNKLLENAKEVSEKWTKDIEDTVNKIKEIGTAFNDTINSVKINSSLNKQFNTNLFGSAEELLSQTLDAYKTEILEYAKNFDLIYNTRNDKLKRLNELSLKLAQGQATEADRVLLDSLKKSEDISKALKDMGLTVEDVTRKNEEFVRIIKQYESFKKASEYVTELTDKIKNFADEFEQIQLDKEFEQEFANKYKQFTDVLKETPTEPIDILKAQLDDAKEKLNILLEESKQLEQMKFNVDGLSLEEFKQQAKEISTQIVQEGFDGSKYTTFFKGFEDLWKGNVLNLQQFQEKFAEFKDELGDEEALSVYYNDIVSKLREIEDLKKMAANTTSEIGLADLKERADAVRNQIKTIIADILSQRISNVEVVDNVALNEAIDNAESFEEVMAAINDQLALNNGELGDTTDIIKDLQEQLKQVEAQTERMNKLKDIFKNIFSFDSMFTNATDEFGNQITTLNDQIVKVLKESSELADQVFSDLQSKMSETLIDMITGGDGFVDQLMDNGFFTGFDASFDELSAKWQNTLQSLGTDASKYFSTTFQSDILSGLSNFDGILGQLIQSSLDTLPRVVEGVMAKLPSLFNELNQTLLIASTNSITQVLNNAIRMIGNALRVDIPTLDLMSPTVNRIENTETQVFNASTPTNITYAYNINGILLYREGALRELAYAIKDVLQEETANAW